MRRENEIQGKDLIDLKSEIEQLRLEKAALQARLEEAEDTLTAIRGGDIDALVVGEDIYTLDSANATANQLRRDVLTQMQDAVLALDEADNVIFMNAAAEDQYGISISAALGFSRSQLYEEVWPDASLQASAMESFRRTGAYRAHSMHLTRSGKELHVESTVSRLVDATSVTIGYLAVIRDITERIHAEEALRNATLSLMQRERQFASIVESSPDIFVRMDRSLRHLYVSPSISSYTGLPPETFIGKTNAELGMPPDLCEQWKTAMDGVFETGLVARIRFKFISVTQQEVHFEARLLPELSDKGLVETVLSIAANVTEQVLADTALRESQTQLDFVLNSAKIGQWWIDVKTGATHHSLYHDQCFGYEFPVENWNYAIFLEHVHPDDMAFVEAQNLTSRDCHFECRVIWADQSIHWIVVHGCLYHDLDRNPLRMLGIIADITERKNAETKLIDSDRRKDEFLATLAHELRNPLAPIRNALQIMRLSHETEIHENARGIIDRQLKQMVHLVDDLLDISRISQGKVELRREYVDVVQLINTAIETSRPLIDASKHQLRTSLPSAATLTVNADVTRLTQLLANLLNNAAKYTPRGGQIEVVAERDGCFAKISVKDSGVGIPPAMLGQVFDMFTQVDRTLDRAQGGLGIGLALVKNLIEMHGGLVEACSEGIGQGSQFIVRIPLIDPVGQLPPAEKDEVEELGSGADLRVLIVDDNIDNVESLSQILQMLGYQTVTADNGLDAVEMARKYQPRVALLDIGLPKMNGHSAARKIREQAWGQDMLLIALSGWGQDSDRKKSADAGFDHHFVKPLNIETLTRLLAPLQEQHGNKLNQDQKSGRP